MTNKQKNTGLEIAIVGMSCRFPGAGNWAEFWDNLMNGKDSFKAISDKELKESGVDENLFTRPEYVKSRVRLENKDSFDYPFFGYRKEEAALMNPTHRILHECIWEAFEDSGYNAEKIEGKVGLYVGAGDDLNWRIHALLANRAQVVDDFSLGYLSGKDSLATLLAYKFNLKGPAVAINTACSTSLVAIHSACNSLLLGETKVALAGGATILTRKQDGYLYQEDSIFSKDGKCNAFDKDATGTVSGEGAGMVVLKRLTDAIKDGDQIHAIIKGSAINNDGNRKVGYTAPSIEGQADCIKKAQRFAKVAPETIDYVEAHGTGTRLGDPVELEALNIAFKTDKDHQCAIGSVKTNIGHLDTAAGVASLIKAVLCLKNKKIPPSLNFKTPNPNINFDKGSFYVNASLKEWQSDEIRRAAVSSFGIGGTNAHVILEESIENKETTSEKPFDIITLSAKTQSSLTQYKNKLKLFLEKNTETSLTDVAATLQMGRKHFRYRDALVFESREGLIAKLDNQETNQNSAISSSGIQPIIFSFAGIGSQYANMGKDIYDTEPVFRKEMDAGFAILLALTGVGYKEIIYPNKKGDIRINNMQYMQPAIFLFGYSLAKLMMSWGFKPSYMMGHSLGEYITACISGVFTFEDALKVVTKRGELMESVQEGAMLSVSLNESSAQAYISDEISLAAINSDHQVVLSGNVSAIEKLEKQLDENEVPFIKLHSNRACHSYMMDSIMDEFKETLSHVTMNSPQIPVIASITGEIKIDTPYTVEYWVQHLRQPVKFSQALTNLLDKTENPLFIEMGSGNVMTTLVKQYKTKSDLITVNLVRHPKEKVNDIKYLTERIGQLWTLGNNIDWTAYRQIDQRKKISIPTYSFDINKLPTEVNLQLDNNAVVFSEATKENDIDEQNEIAKIERPQLKNKYIPAHTDTEKKLTSMLEEFFGIEQVGIEDDFFELGGDSLKAMMLIKRINTEFEISIGLQDFFQTSNLKEVAAEIDEKLWINSESKKQYVSTI